MITNSTGGDEWVGIDDIRFGGISLLPIKLKTFSATEKNGSVALNWNALSENGMDNFEIERSADAVQFYNIGSVKAKEPGTNDYLFTDISPLNGTGFYRLKLINSDGKFIYSNIVDVKLSLKDIYINLLYPSITDSRINLLVTASKSAVASLQIVNIQGSVVKSFSRNLHVGINDILIDVKSLSPGNYFIRINLNSESFIKRFIKY